MIKSFADKRTEAMFEARTPKGFPADLWKRAYNALHRIDNAAVVEDLRFPPSARLHPLQGNRAGTWSLRVNDQFRITFRFEDGHAHDVQFEDYHP